MLQLNALLSVICVYIYSRLFSVIFTTIGVSFTDALFEVGSALTTNGISMGAATVSMPIAYKWLMIAAMTIGRVEIMSVLIALIPHKTTENNAQLTALQWVIDTANST